jgi:hypothetical protein
MASTEQSIFRESAVKRYTEGRERNVLLRLVSPPVFMFLWILLPLFIGAIVLTWSVQVPVLAAGQGVVIEQPMSTGSTAPVANATATTQATSKGKTTQTSNAGVTGQVVNTGKAAQVVNRGKTTNKGKTTHTGKAKQATNTGKTKQTTNNKKTAQATNTGKIELTAFNGNIEQATNDGSTAQAGTEVVALLFLSPEQQTNLHVGEPVNINIGSGMGSFTGSIERVEAGVLSPSDIRTRFNLQGVLAQAISGPSAVATVRLGPDSSMRTYVGSLCRANVQVGSESVLTMMPGFDQISELLNGQFFQMLYEQIRQFLK